MNLFNIHFLKEVRDTREPFDGMKVIEYLEQKFNARVHPSEDLVIISCDHPRLPYSLKVIMSKGSIIPNLYSLNPNFRDIKVHISLDPSIPNYIARDFLVIGKELAEKFNFYSYNEFLEDVTEFNVDFFLGIFSSYKETFFERNPGQAEKFLKISESRMSAVLRYLDEKLNLESFFKNSDVVVPGYRFLKTDNKKLRLAMNWVENTATLFPPYIDYIYFRSGELIYLYNANEIFEVLEPYLENVPGFIKEAKLLPNEVLKKATKALRKARLASLILNFAPVELEKIID